LGRNKVLMLLERCFAEAVVFVCWH
jgi:hypothetical protein